MATVIEVEDLRNGYVDVVHFVREYGQHVSPRGLATTELQDVIIKLYDPTNALPVGVGRKINPAIAAAEALQLIGSVSEPELMVKISPRFGDFLDDGRFWGAYGVRMRRQINAVERKLREDPDTRQAVITLWDPDMDNRPEMHDYPCTIMLAFTIRTGELNMHVVMRSNDVWLGLAYDAFQFTQLQVTLAGVLGVDVGSYTHHAVSLHLYDRDLPAAAELKKVNDEDFPFLLGIDGISMQEAKTRAATILLADDLPSLTSSEQWYWQTIRPYVLG